MGQSTDAILFYGYCWEDEKAAPWLVDDAESVAEDDEDWEERYARAMGMHGPSVPFPATSDKSSEAERVRDEFRAYWTRKSEIAKASGCRVDSHCSGDCPMPLVAVEASVTRASRGYPVSITSLEVRDGWGEQLDAFCRAMGITPPDGQKPGWWLVSDWN